MTKQPENQPDNIEDLEICSKQNRRPRKNKRYRIRIDKKHYVVDVSEITGRELLLKAGIAESQVDCWRIRQKLRGGKLENIALDQVVDLTAPGIERFTTLPLDQKEGRGFRREFQMPSRDVEFLEAEGYEWETVGTPGSGWILLRRFPITSGYNLQSATVALKIEAGYDDSPIDMAYFFPALSRKDGVAIKAIANQEIDGATYQRWSRHRTAQNPWRPGVDYLGTHLGLVAHWLERELT